MCLADKQPKNLAEHSTLFQEKMESIAPEKSTSIKMTMRYGTPIVVISKHSKAQKMLMTSTTKLRLLHNMHRSRTKNRDRASSGKKRIRDYEVPRKQQGLQKV